METLEENVQRVLREEIAIQPYDPRWPRLFQSHPSSKRRATTISGERRRFRDHLIAHPDVAAEYGKLKLRLAGVHRHDRVASTRRRASSSRG
jgi:GrpB-like predicted nucleotidyltransferase (UPF0157 family)